MQAFQYKPFLFLIILLLSLARPGLSPAADKPNGRINVILWFDTEDYLLPADDDASKRLAEMLSERGIRATFKIVGEKARVLEKRGRTDVIAALKKHDIGYHANFHSVHPTPSEYLADCGLLDGVAEFARREGPGAADVRRVFDIPTLSCYGQPGSSWGPQTLAGLLQIGVAPHGIPCYVDEGNHIGLNAKPFWYEGALVVYAMGPNWTRMDLHDPAAVEPAKKKVSAIADRLRSEDGGGLISIFYHPCEWVHQEFWDGVNFRRGANPPREEWKAPPQRPKEETESAFQRFGEYIDHIRQIPGVRFVTASDLTGIYQDYARQEPGVPIRAVAEIVSRLDHDDGKGATFQMIGGKSYSLSDQFEVLLGSVTNLINSKPTSYPVRLKGLMGPDGACPRKTVTHVTWPAFRDTTSDVAEYVRLNQRIPARVFFGADPVDPLDYLVAMAKVLTYHKTSQKLPLEQGVDLGPTPEFLPAKQVAEDTPGLFGGWVIHKEGFRAPHILDVARLQTWTLKPAIRKD